LSALQEYEYGMDDTDQAGDESGDEAGPEAGAEPPRLGTARPGTDGAEAAAGSDADFRALAEDWIAIWQSEITAYLTDPETHEAWGAMMAVWAGAAQAMMRAMPAAPGFGSPFGPPGMRPPRRPKPAAPAREARTKPAPAESPGPDAAPRPAPAAAAPVARDDEIRRLEQRVAELERHLADQDRRRGAAGDNRRPRRASRPRG
jgi:hypothetical protein